MKLPNAVFFDLFHTLVDVGKIPDEVGRYTADVLGVDRRSWNEACFSAHHDICRPTRHIDTIRALAHSIDPDISEELIAEAVADRQRRFDYTLEQVDDAVLAVLRRLRDAGIRLGLISNASTAEVAAWGRSPMAELFDVAVFSCDCGYRKPDVRIYRQALDALGVEAGQAVFVGDGGSDEHRGAREVGLFSVLTTEHLEGMEEGKLRERRALVGAEIAALGELLAVLGLK